jgi:ComF family protein
MASNDGDAPLGCQMSMRTILNDCRNFGRALLAQDCFLCGAPDAGELLCRECRDDLPRLPRTCPRCALPSRDRALCGACLRQSPRYDRTVAIWRYHSPCDRLVQALKYHARLPLAPFFAAALAERIAADGTERVDVAVPMPLHRFRLRERGFNHALEIARPLARALGVPLLQSGVERRRHTTPQTALPYPERAANVRGAFACRLDLRQLRVAVIDDVMTTGTTLDELAGVLKRAGAVSVHNWVVARTLLD